MFSLNIKLMEDMFRILTAVTSENHEKCADLAWERKTDPSDSALNRVAGEFNANLHRVNLVKTCKERNCLVFFISLGNDLKAIHEGTFEYLRNRAVFMSLDEAMQALPTYLEQSPVAFIFCMDISCLSGWVANPFAEGTNLSEPMLPHLLGLEMHWMLNGYMSSASLPIYVPEPDAVMEEPELKYQAQQVGGPTA